MDFIDTFAFMGWSMMLVGVADINGWPLLSCQAAWLTSALIGRKLIDRYVEAR